MRTFLAALARVTVRLLLALLPGLMLGAYSRYPAMAFLGYAAIVPWVLLYTDDRRRKVPLAYYFVGAYFAWLMLYPEFFKYGWLPPLAMGAVYFVPWLLFAPLLRSIHHRLLLPRTLTVPLVWVAVEWLRTTLTLGHFDLFPLGYSQARFPALVQIADITGVYGVSFLVTAVSGLTADLVFALRDNGGSVARAFRVRRVWLGAIAVATTFGLVCLYGAYRLGTARNEPGPRVALVQPNVLHTLRNSVGVHLSQVRLTEVAVEPSAADLIVWPENAILDDIYREGAYLDDLAWLAASKHAPMLVGALAAASDSPGQTRNGAFLIDESGAITGQYDKRLLFPWSEYVPGDTLLRWAVPAAYRAHRMITRNGWGYVATGLPGHGMTLFHLPWHGEDLAFAALICHETIRPPLVAEAGRSAARFLVNITSEGEVGGPIQEQMLRICILRAIESRAPLLRAGNTGISCFIDAQGRVRSVLHGERGRTINDAGVLIDRVSLSPPTVTLYSRSHDAFAVACVALTAVLLAWGLLRPRRGAAAAAVVLAALAATAGCYPVPEIGSDAGAAPGALERGLELAQQGPEAYRAAIDELAAACAEPSTCRQAIPYIAEGFRQLQQMEVGAEFFLALARRHPTMEGLASGYAGFFLEKAGYLEQAVERFRRSLELEPTAEVYRWLGKLELRMGERDRAIETLRTGLDLAPDDVEIRALLGKALRRAGALDEARSLLLEVIAARLDHGSAWVDLGRIRMAEGDERGAVTAFRRAIEVVPDNIEARFMLARRALREGRMEDADRLLEEIRQIESTLGRGPRED